MSEGQEWPIELQRLVRRRKIEQVMQEPALSVNKIKQAARMFETSEDIPRIAEQLSSEANTESSEMTNFAQNFLRKAEKVFGDRIAGVSKTGSQVFGGKIVRALFGNEKASDFDIGVIYRGAPLSKEDLSQLDNIFKELLTDSRFPSQDHKILRNASYCLFENETQVKAFIEKQPITKDNSYGAMFITALLLPTTPPEIGQMNKQRIFTALQSINREDHDKWEVVVNGIYKEWKEIHSLKENHFAIPGEANKLGRQGIIPGMRTMGLMTAVSKLSQKAMNEQMKQWLMSTAS